METTCYHCHLPVIAKAVTRRPSGERILAMFDHPRLDGTLCPGPARAFVQREDSDTWLREIGARVIRVEDLGAAMEALEGGGRAVEHATRPPFYGWAQPIGTYKKSFDAAHLARRATGE